MGQVRRSRQRGVQYKDVELELWELDTDKEEKRYNGRSRSGSAGRINSRNRGSSGSAPNNRSGSRTGNNIRLYEQRQRSVSRKGSACRDSASRTRSACRGSARPVQSIRRRRAKRRKAYITRAVALLVIVTCLILIYHMTGQIYRLVHDRTGRGILHILSNQVDDGGSKIAPPEIVEDFLEVNDFSRPSTELKEVKNIFVHYTANPRTSAKNNRSYFANLPLTKERSASAHLIIGYDGEIIQCIPFDEQAYAVKTRNGDSISIECCYTSEDGSFTQETYDTLIHTLAWLTDKYHLSEEDILRHYDCGGKLCPLYYVEHEDAWEQLLADVAAYRADAG